MRAGTVPSLYIHPLKAKGRRTVRRIRQAPSLDGERKASGVNPRNRQSIQINHKGVTYIWTSKAGFVRPDGMRVPESLRPILECMIEDKINAEDEAITDVDELTVRAEQARQQKQLNRAERLVQRAKTILGDDSPELSATLGAVYVERNEIQLAMDEVEPFSDMRHAGIQQVIALAMNALANDIPDTGDRMADARKRDSAKKRAREAWQFAKSILTENGNNGWPQFEALAGMYGQK